LPKRARAVQALKKENLQMKKIANYLFLMSVNVCAIATDFDYTISDTYYNDTLTLNSQSVQVTGEGVDKIVANGASYVEVTNTTPYQYNVGGIRRTELYDTSTANISGGEFDYIGTYDTAILNISGGSAVDVGFGGNTVINMSGGYLSGVFLHENAEMDFTDGEIRWINTQDSATAIFSGGLIETISCYQQSDVMKHVTLICNIDSVNYNETTKLLTGDWLDSSSFSIKLIDHAGYDSAFSNIQFIPEPTTLVLFSLGGLLIRRRKS
jgi:hypothetical protein